MFVIYLFTFADKQEIETTEPFCNWTLKYPKDNAKLGNHQLNVEVFKKYIVWYPVAESSAKFDLVDSLTGSLELIQNQKVRKQDFVSTQEMVNHSIDLWPADDRYLKENNYYINTYWFENCTYLGMSHAYDYQAIYPEA